MARSHHDRNEEETLRLAAQYDKVRRGDARLELVLRAPVGNEHVSDAAATEHADGHARVAREDAVRHVVHQLAGDAMVAVGGGEAGENGAFVGHAKGVAAHVERGHADGARGAVVEHGHDGGLVRVEVDNGQQGGGVGLQQVAHAEQHGFGRGERAQKGHARLVAAAGVRVGAQKGGQLTGWGAQLLQTARALEHAVVVRGGVRVGELGGSYEGNDLAGVGA